MEGSTGMDGGRVPWSSGSSSYSTISSSGTLSTTYTSRGSRLSSASASASAGATMRFHMEFDKEKTEKEQIEEVKSLVQEFYGAPSSAVQGGDMSVLERWFTELGVAWVLHISQNGGASAAGMLLVLEKDLRSRPWSRALTQVTDLWTWPWIRALTEITDSIRLVASSSSLYTVGRLTSIYEEEEEHEAESGNQAHGLIQEQEQSRFAQFIQITILKMVACVDVIVDPNGDQQASRDVRVSRLLGVHGALSSALTEIQLSFGSSPSAQVKKIQGEMVSLLSDKERKVGEAIWSTMEQIRTDLVLDDSTSLLTPQASSGIHKVTRSLVHYISFLRSRYASVAPIVSEAARLGKYVPRFESGLVPPLISLLMDMASCVQERLTNMSESFADQSLESLFLFNNSFFIREELKYTFYFLQFPVPELPCKVEGYMESYLQVSWAPVLSCLLNPTPLCFGINNSSLSKFESEFQKTYTTQKQWEIPSPQLRKMMRKAITDKLVPAYRRYILDNKVTTPKLTPKELEEMLKELFEG